MLDIDVMLCVRMVNVRGGGAVTSSEGSGSSSAATSASSFLDFFFLGFSSFSSSSQSIILPSLTVDIPSDYKNILLRDC